MSPMTHRQRVQAALNHQEPDLVPLDLGTGGNTSPVPEVYEKLCALYGLDYQLRLVPHMMRLAVVDERILQTLDIDTRPIYMHPTPGRTRPCSQPGYFYDEWGVKWREYNATESSIVRWPRARWKKPLCEIWMTMPGGLTRWTPSVTKG